MNVIKTLAESKIVILISHRLANIVNSNLIYFLHDEKISESGTHQQLMKKNGEYAKIFTKQKELESINKNINDIKG